MLQCLVSQHYGNYVAVLFSGICCQHIVLKCYAHDHAILLYFQYPILYFLKCGIYVIQMQQ